MAIRLTLRDLLLLDIGALEGNNAAQVRVEIDQNPNCRRVWELIHRVSTELNQGTRTYERLTQSGFDFGAEVVAAYIDGTLEKEQRKQLEREAIRSPRLLRELLLHFRQQFSDGSECLVPWSATEKLFQLGQGLENGVATQRQSSSPDMVVAALSQSSSTAKPVGIQMARPVAVAYSKKQSKAPRKWGVVIAAAATAGLLGAVWISGGFTGWQANAGKTNELAALNAKPNADVAANAEASRRMSEQSPMAAIDLPPTRSLPAAGSGEWALVTLEEPIAPENGDTGTELDPSASVFHQQSGVLEDLTWLKLEGVVALREKGKETWFGPRSSSRIFNGLEWQTLPGSWVSARLGKLGEIVVDADSLVAVSVLPGEQLIGLDMQAGRIGLKKLAAQSKLKVKYDRLEWNVEVLSDGTTVGLDWLNGAPRLSVYGGSVRTAEQVVAGRQQLVWNDLPQATTGRANANSILSPLGESFAWLNNPVKVNVLSETDQAELLASVNVVNSLNRLGANRPASDRVLAQYLPAVLSPEVHLLDVLEGAEQTSREEALQWLMGLSPRSPKTRQVWRTIAEKSGAPDHTREFFRLVQFARNSAPINELDARFLTSGLKHERMFVREMSQLLLEYGFGNTARYDAAAEPGNRNLAADQWTRDILQSYQQSAVPKR